MVDRAALRGSECCQTPPAVGFRCSLQFLSACMQELRHRQAVLQQQRIVSILLLLLLLLLVLLLLGILHQGLTVVDACAVHFPACSLRITQ